MTDQVQVKVPAGETKRVQLQAEAPPVLCRRFGDLNFEFDRAFIIPEQAADMLIDISNYANQFTSRQILIVGHTDTKGPPDYNVRLSERRGMSMYAHLTGNETVWESMYNADNSPNRKWGNREGRHMLRFLRDDSDNVYFTGTADDEGSESTETIKRFQRDNDLNDDGDAGFFTHRAMFRKLVEALRPQGLGIAANRFLAPRSDEFWLGCGERHLALPTPDETPEEANRRVEVLLFLNPPSPINCDTYDPNWIQTCIQTELISVEVLIHNEYANPVASEFTLQTPEGETLREVTGQDGFWRSLPDSMPPGRYALTINGKEVTLVR